MFDACRRPEIGSLMHAPVSAFKHLYIREISAETVVDALMHAY
jgi:hypothetical protein